MDKMGATITALLEIARGGEHTGTRTTVQEVVTAVLDAHPGVERTAGRGRRVRRIVRVALAATTELAVRAMSPLVDNALRHAAIPGHRQLLGRPTGRRRSTSPTTGPASWATRRPCSSAGARDESSPGAGLGLPLARRVAKTLGGQVDVTSVAEPTTFTLTLPRS